MSRGSVPTDRSGNRDLHAPEVGWAIKAYAYGICLMCEPGPRATRPPGGEESVQRTNPSA